MFEAGWSVVVLSGLRFFMKKLHKNNQVRLTLHP
jgi:hypothetical protein